MDRIEIFFAILITSVIQSMAFPVLTVTYGDHEINELIRSSNPPRAYEYQSNTPRALPDSSDQIEKMKSILGALMRSEKPASEDKNMKQLNSLIRKLSTGKKEQRKQSKKRRNISDQAAPRKLSNDIQRAASETEEVDVVPEEEAKLSQPKVENLASSEEEKAIPPKERNLESSEGENLTPTKEDQSPLKDKNLELPDEEKPAQPKEEKLASPKEEKLAPTKEEQSPPKDKNLESPDEEKPVQSEEEKLTSPKEEKLALPKEEKEKADLKEPEESSKVGKMEILNQVYNRLSSLVDSKKMKSIFNLLNENERSPIVGI